MRMADGAADDAHLRAALLRIAKRARAEIDDSIDAARVIDDSLKVAVERVAARKIRQARSKWGSFAFESRLGESKMNSMRCGQAARTSSGG
jgi:hypothetical protein